MSELDAHLVDLLRPLVRQLVRDELAHEREQWRWQSIRRAAEILDMTHEGLYKRVLRGQVPHARIGNRLYVDMVELDHQLGRVQSGHNKTKDPRAVRGGHDTRS